MMQKFYIKHFYFSCNSFFETFVFVFTFYGNVVLLFREHLFAYFIFSKP